MIIQRVDPKYHKDGRVQIGHLGDEVRLRDFRGVVAGPNVVEVRGAVYAKHKLERLYLAQNFGAGDICHQEYFAVTKQDNGIFAVCEPVDGCVRFTGEGAARNEYEIFNLQQRLSLIDFKNIKHTLPEPKRQRIGREVEIAFARAAAQYGDQELDKIVVELNGNLAVMNADILLRQ